MTTTFNIHLDAGVDTFVVWWADSPDVPGLSIAADSLAELRRLIDEAAELHLPAGTELEYLLAGDQPEATRPAASAEVRPEGDAVEQTFPGTAGLPVWSKWITLPVAA